MNEKEILEYAQECGQEAAATFLERKSIKKNFNLALQTAAIPSLPHGNVIALLIEE